MARRPPYELELRTHGGGRYVVPFGRFGLTVLTLMALTTAALLGAGLARLPGRLSSALQARETDVLLARRAQLGERLRALAERYQQLEEQSGRALERLERVRMLYGLPRLEPRRRPAQASPPPRDSIFSAAMFSVARLATGIDETLSRAEQLLATLAHWEAEHPGEAANVPARLPVRAHDAVAMAYFGEQRNPLTGEVEFNGGLDLAAPAGATIVAPAAGVVRWAGEAPPSSGGSWWRLGSTVVIAHGDRYRTLFGHCDRLLVRVGQRVAAGQPIGTVGSSGFPTSPRLHYEVRRRSSEGAWEALDPTALLLDLGDLESDLMSARPRGAKAGTTSAPPFPAAFAR